MEIKYLRTRNTISKAESKGKNAEQLKTSTMKRIKKSSRTLRFFVDGVPQIGNLDPALMEQLLTEKKNFEEKFNVIMQKVGTSATFKSLKQLAREE